jgi:uncharacterized MAPEG superfamily protein
MKPELMLLLWSIALMFAQMLVSTIGAQLQVGLPMLAGNHEKFPEITGWAGRARRAYYNMIDNMVLFVPLVLVAVMIGKTNDTTLLGAQLFVWARLVYAIVYLIGIPWLRTGVWVVSVVGLVMIFVQLV